MSSGRVSQSGGSYPLDSLSNFPKYQNSQQSVQDFSDRRQILAKQQQASQSPFSDYKSELEYKINSMNKEVGTIYAEE